MVPQIVTACFLRRFARSSQDAGLTASTSVTIFVSRWARRDVNSSSYTLARLVHCRLASSRGCDGRTDAQMTDAKLARIVRNTFSDAEYDAFVDWAQSTGDHMFVRAELARIQQLVDRGRL